MFARDHDDAIDVADDDVTGVHQDTADLNGQLGGNGLRTAEGRAGAGRARVDREAEVPADLHDVAHRAVQDCGHMAVGDGTRGHQAAPHGNIRVGTNRDADHTAGLGFIDQVQGMLWRQHFVGRHLQNRGGRSDNLVLIDARRDRVIHVATPSHNLVAGIGTGRDRGFPETGNQLLHVHRVSLLWSDWGIRVCRARPSGWRAQ